MLRPWRASEADKHPYSQKPLAEQATFCTNVDYFTLGLRSRQGDSGTETEYLPNYPKAGIAVTLIASKQRCLRKLRAVGLLCAAPEVRDLSR
jgi:hypothetical protein